MVYPYLILEPIIILNILYKVWKKVHHQLWSLTGCLRYSSYSSGETAYSKNKVKLVKPCKHAFKINHTLSMNQKLEKYYQYMYNKTNSCKRADLITCSYTYCKRKYAKWFFWGRKINLQSCTFAKKKKWPLLLVINKCTYYWMICFKTIIKAFYE